MLENSIKEVKETLINSLGKTNCFLQGSSLNKQKNRENVFVEGIKLERIIDHTLLKVDTKIEDIEKLCEEARMYNFFSVCIPPYYVSLAKELLKGCETCVCTVIGFPLGANTGNTKAVETRDAIANGAAEVDMVINIGLLKSKQWQAVKEDIESVVKAANGQAVVKVILETGILTEEEKIAGCLLTQWAGADYVKTSTGFGNGGATVEDIRLMAKVTGNTMGVKASGGVRDYTTVRQMLKAGATRIGASASIAIVKQVTPEGEGTY